VRLVEINPEYNKGTLVNTLALLFLEIDFELADHIDTICLPDYQEKFENSSDCFVKGWGKDTFGKDGQYQAVLKEVSLPVVPRDQCLTWLKATRLGRRFKLDQSFLCAGGEAGKDACRGDGGGPLVCPQKDDPAHYTQVHLLHKPYLPSAIKVGVVAWGIGCGEEDVPGVYTDVSEQVCWIDWTMACQLKDKHVLRYRQECNTWLHKKQEHKFPPVRNIYKACNIDWSFYEESEPVEQWPLELPDQPQPIFQVPAGFGLAAAATPSYRNAWCKSAVRRKSQLKGNSVCCHHNVVLANVKGIHCQCCKLYNIHCNMWLRPHCKYMY